MKILPLTVLFHEGPMARAYLEIMRREGFKAQTILRMVPAPGPLARWLPGGFRRSMSAMRNEKLANHWPRVLAERFPGLCREMTDRIEGAFRLGDGFIAALRGGGEIAAYAETVHDIELRGLKDPALPQHLGRYVQTPILFTGGGILPPAVFAVPGIRLLHVHPGYLPPVKGADGLLWSTLVRGRPGASAFLMAPGLDVGDLLDASETEPLTFDIPEGERPGDDDLYRLVFSFYDPVLRAHALRALLPLLESGSELVGTPQNEAEGLTYHFMEARMRHRALARLFRKDEALS